MQLKQKLQWRLVSIEGGNGVKNGLVARFSFVGPTPTITGLQVCLLEDFTANLKCIFFFFEENFKCILRFNLFNIFIYFLNN